MAELGALVVLVILGMAVVTYATKAGGLWLLGHVEVGERTETALETLPGAIIVAIVAPELAGGGPSEWAAATLAAIVAWRTDNLLIALAVAMAAVLFFRGI